MKILFIASEAAPLAKVGGLADVVGSLPKALKGLGHDVRILMPQYGSIDTARFPLTRVQTGVRVDLPQGAQTVNLNQTLSDGVPVYTLENQAYFGTPEIYGGFDNERFFFFSRAAFAILPEMAWQPEILHCHDWLTALTVMWAKKAGYPYQTIFTIHNLAYQGFFDDNFMSRQDLKPYWEDLPAGAPALPHTFLAQAVLRADRVTTVSETYAREITTPEYGVGLDALLRYRAAQGALTGIINGIDEAYWDPQKDAFLPVNFSTASLHKRVHNKSALQKLSGLPVNSEIPLIGMVQRLDEQKGLDILGQGLEQMLQETGAQLVIVGRGREHYEGMLRYFTSRYPQQVAAFIAFEESLAHLIYAGCDMFLMPSRFEPCGLGQMIAMRYGALPIVRRTGGLADTVPAFNEDLSTGNGFVFQDYSPGAMVAAVKKASEAYKNKRNWAGAMRRVSRQDFSWQSSALKYEAVYKQVLETRR